MVVPLAEDVFGAVEPFGQRRVHAALEQHGPRLLAEPLQQREVLHVARADLQHVGVACDQFHLLRRQALRRWRKPLVVFTPKSLLRHPGCLSPLAEMGAGTGFRPVLSDLAEGAERALICSGKVAAMLAAVVVFGLTTSTVLTLFVLPTIYRRFEED